MKADVQGVEARFAHKADIALMVFDGGFPSAAIIPTD
jgi:hypothetical protein